MNNEKLNFITTTFPQLIQQANPTTEAQWGKMNLQQMIEHVTDFFKVSSNTIHFTLVSPEENLPRLKSFLLSDKEFRENTKAPEQIVPNEPLPIKNESVDLAIQELKAAIENFIAYFETNKNATTIHPVFGALNFEEWILLHYKHVLHHSKQFLLIQ